MPYFHTGLEALLEKIAAPLPMPRAIPRPKPSAAPGGAPKPPPKVTPPAPGGPAAPKPAAPAAPKPAAGKAQPGYPLTPAEKAQAAKLENFPTPDGGRASRLPCAPKFCLSARAIVDKFGLG